eukprot:4603532-Amphidinium_carterae.1
MTAVELHLHRICAVLTYQGKVLEAMWADVLVFHFKVTSLVPYGRWFGTLHIQSITYLNEFD